MGATTSIIRVAILGEEKSLGEAVRKSNEHLDKLSKKAKTTGQKLTAGSNKIVAAAAAGGLAIAGIAIKNGDELNEAEDQLDNAVERSHQSVKGLTKAIDPLQKRMERFGYTNKDVDESLTILTRSGMKLKDAIKDEAIAADLAKAKHLSLADATNIVAKASLGQIKPLRALNIDVPIAAGGALKLANANKAAGKAYLGVVTATGKMREAQVKASAIIADAIKRHLKGRAAAAAYAKAQAIVSAASTGLTKAQAKMRDAEQKVNDTRSAGGKILSAVAKVVKGSAETSTKSLAGKVAELKAKFTDMTAHLGQKLIPIVILVANKFMGLVDFFEHNRAALVALTIAVGLFVAGVTALFIIDKVNRMTAAWTKIQEALNIQMGLCPAVLIAAAIAGLVAGVIYAYRNFKWFHDAVDKAWQVLQIGFHWITSNWPLLLAILTGPIGLAVLVISRHWDTIVGFVKAIPGRIAGFAAGMWHGITDSFSTAVHWIGQRGEDIISWFSGLPGKVVKALGYIGSAITSPFRAAFNLVASAWNNTIGKVHFSVPDWVPFVGGDGWGFPRMPTFHVGGRFQAPFGQSEGLAVLRQNERVQTPEQLQRDAMSEFAGAGAGGGGSFTYNAPSGANDRDVMRAINRYNRRNGRR